MDINDDVRPDDIIKVITREPKDQGLKDIPVIPSNYKKFLGEKRRGALPKGIFWGMVGLIIFFIAGTAITF